MATSLAGNQSRYSTSRTNGAATGGSEVAAHFDSRVTVCKPVRAFAGVVQVGRGKGGSEGVTAGPLALVSIGADISGIVVLWMCWSADFKCRPVSEQGIELVSTLARGGKRQSTYGNLQYRCTSPLRKWRKARARPKPKTLHPPRVPVPVPVPRPAVASGFHRPRRLQRVDPGQVQPRRGPGAGRGAGPVRPLPQILRPPGCGGRGWSPHRQGRAHDGRRAVRRCLSRIVPCLGQVDTCFARVHFVDQLPDKWGGEGGGEGLTRSRVWYLCCRYGVPC